VPADPRGRTDRALDRGAASRRRPARPQPEGVPGRAKGEWGGGRGPGDEQTGHVEGENAAGRRLGYASPAVLSARPLRRRSVLAAVAMTFPLLAAGCKGVGALGTPPLPLPDVAVLDHAIAAEKLMIARYHAAISGSPAQAAFLAPLLAQHRAHLARLGSRLLDPRAASPAGSPSPGAAASPASPASLAPSAPAVTLAALRAAEQDAASALVRHLAEVSPSFAQLLASIAASEASHALLLRSRAGA
jgi:hypothetical protein